MRVFLVNSSLLLALLFTSPIYFSKMHNRYFSIQRAVNLLLPFCNLKLFEITLLFLSPVPPLHNSLQNFTRNSSKQGMFSRSLSRFSTIRVPHPMHPEKPEKIHMKLTDRGEGIAGSFSLECAGRKIRRGS